MFNITKVKSEAKPAPALFSVPATKETRRDAAWLAARLARSKLFGPREMETETVDMTPALAELMMGHNSKNRPITRKKVEQFGRAYKAGDWMFNAQGIIFDRDGALADGQHRLLAIIETGITVPMRVTFGQNPEAFTVLDTGKPRSGADVLKIAGYQYWTNLAAGARVYSIVTSATPLGNLSITNDAVLEIVRSKPLMAEVCCDAVRIATRLRAPSAALVAGLYLIRQCVGNSVKYSDFVDRLAEGTNLSKRDPILVLREMFVTNSFDVKTEAGKPVNSGNKASRICAAVIICWNKWIQGRTASPTTLRWNGTSAFPSVE